MIQVEQTQDSLSLLQLYESVIDETHSENSELRVISFRRAMGKIERKIPGFSSKSRPSLVDIGCAGGEFPSAANSLGFDVIGFEPSSHLSAIGRDRYGLDIRSGPFSSQSLNGKKIDIITMWDVLEHVDSPKKVLSEISQVLDKSGYLVLNLPMIDTLSARILRYKWPFYLQVHLYYFTMKSISKYLEDIDFQILYSRPYTQTLSIDYLVRRATGGKIKRFPISLPLRYRMGQRTIVAQRKN